MGLTVVHVEAEVIVLESLNQQLVLHALPSRVAATIEMSSPLKLRTDTAVKLVFAANIAEARVKAPALGGGVNPKKKEFEARGFRACDGHDPEGNVIQFREHVL